MTIAVVINPMAGRDQPILRTLHSFLIARGHQWLPLVTQYEGHATELVTKAVEHNAELILVNGGDGTVMEAAHALIGTNIPMLVIPGGTANVVAKEFHIPHTIPEALELIDTGKVVSVDTYETNNVAGFIRINHGIFADVIITTTQENKQALGSLAYTVESLKQAFAAHPTTYTITIDDKKITTEGIGLSITNLASVGLGTLRFHTAVHPHDGLLDVIVAKHIHPEIIPNLLNSVVWSGNENSVEHYQGSSITVELPTTEQFIIDDMIHSAKTITASVTNNPLKLLVPPSYAMDS